MVLKNKKEKRCVSCLNQSAVHPDIFELYMHEIISFPCMKTSQATQGAH
jgi:hypothetical protein